MIDDVILDEFGDVAPPNIFTPFYTEINEVHEVNGKLFCKVGSKAYVIEWKINLNKRSSVVFAILNINEPGIRSIWRDHRNKIIQFIIDSIKEKNKELIPYYTEINLREGNEQ